MLKYKISDKEYEDGCLQGILQVMNEKTNEVEIYTFVFDSEIGSLDMIRRTFVDWNAPFHEEKISEYVTENYYDIKENIIKEVREFNILG